MVLNGYIDDDLNPILEGIYLVGQKRMIPLKVVLDAGFNDEFCIPEKFYLNVI